jgi:hypothetical protein
MGQCSYEYVNLVACLTPYQGLPNAVHSCLVIYASKVASTILKVSLSTHNLAKFCVYSYAPFL